MAGFTVLLASGCSSAKKATTTSPAESLQPIVDSIRMAYAPDKRVALFDITVKGQILTGETDNVVAKTALLQNLSAKNIRYIDSIQVLPDASVMGKNRAVVTISVANLRAKPAHAAEMVTQATLGTPLNVLKKEKGWYLVQTPDKYIAWTEGGGIQTMDDNRFVQWQQADKLIYTKPYGFIYTKPDADGATVSDVVYGDVLSFQTKENDFYYVKLPDGRSGYIPAKELQLYKEWQNSRMPTQENLVSASKRLMGVPYLWGGTSFKGVDCSGFTRTVYFMNGLILPRDASQQALIGELVDTKTGWQNLQAGDLLFFGVPAQDGKPERVIHVGMWLGGPNNEFIQSSSKVQISSLNPDAPNYDEVQYKRFLRAKRITQKSVLFDLRFNSFY